MALFAPQTRETADRKQEAKEEQGNKPWGAAVTALRLNHKSPQEIKGAREEQPPAPRIEPSEAGNCAHQTLQQGVYWYMHAPQTKRGLGD